MFPFEGAGGEAGWDAYGGPVRPGDFGATGLAAGPLSWCQVVVNMHVYFFVVFHPARKGCPYLWALSCNKPMCAARFLRPAKA